MCIVWCLELLFVLVLWDFRLVEMALEVCESLWPSSVEEVTVVAIELVNGTIGCWRPPPEVVLVAYLLLYTLPAKMPPPLSSTTDSVPDDVTSGGRLFVAMGVPGCALMLWGMGRLLEGVATTSADFMLTLHRHNTTIYTPSLTRKDQSQSLKKRENKCKEVRNKWTISL